MTRPVFGAGRIARRIFTPEDDAEIVRLAASGASVRAICMALSAGRRGVAARLAHLGVTVTTRASYAFTAKEDADILARLAAGDSASAIARDLGVGHQTILGRTASLELGRAGRPARLRRPCLRCRVPFASDGPGNRLCRRCVDYAAEQSGCLL